MDDLISRAEVISLLKDKKHWDECGIYVVRDIEKLSPAQEIIRCKDCKYRDKNWRRVSVRWLPCMEVQTGSNWYCGSAERGEQE